MMEKIDFVLIWVDGSDQAWLKEKNKYSSKKIDCTNNSSRYRDWGILKYWFRGVEKYAPWVNNIYFVTWGHLPKWLNTKNPKLRIINHKDFIPSEYLPTFSANPIELNLHRIKELSDNFVYFNDDMFIINRVKKEDYFKNNMPVSNFFETVYLPDYNNSFGKMLYNNVSILNNEFNKRNFIKNNFSKVFNLKNTLKHNLETLLLLPYPKFSSIGIYHSSSSMKKETYNYLWKKYYDVLNETSKHKFRDSLDVTQYLIKDYQNLTGNFCVRNKNFSKFMFIKDKNDLKQASVNLFNEKYKELCINDEVNDLSDKEIEEIIRGLQEIFEHKFPNKCSFEK